MDDERRLARNVLETGQAASASPRQRRRPRGTAAVTAISRRKYGVEEGAKGGFARIDALLEKIAA